jgi:two-component system response regulator WspF
MVAVGIVNDSADTLVRLKRIVRETPGFHVVWTARGTDLALLQHRAHTAQMVLLDVSLSDGPATVARLIALHPCVVLLVTDDPAGKRQLIFEATGNGAQDAIATPASDKPADTHELHRKLVMLGRLPHFNLPANAAAVLPPGSAALPYRPSVVPQDRPLSSDPPAVIIGIGASTGGPQALATILHALPAELEASIVVVQHMDEQFVPGLQQWLRNVCTLPVELAVEGDALRGGTVLLAHTQNHLVLESGPAGSVTVRYTTQPEESAHRPSVDVFFDSLARLSTSRACCGVLLTGMGRDGAQGLLRLRGRGVLTIAQDQESSAVYGMPQAAMAAGAVDAATPLTDIAGRLVEFIRNTSTTARR